MIFQAKMLEGVVSQKYLVWTELAEDNGTHCEENDIGQAGLFSVYLRLTEGINNETLFLFDSF